MSQEAKETRAGQNFPSSVFRGRGFCLELAGCASQGLRFSHHAGLLLSLASVLVVSLVCAEPGSKILPGPSLEQKTVDCG